MRFCPHHPLEQISNFCANPTCLTALCPTCICQHTQFHIRMRTSPVYENLKQTQARYEERIREQMIKIGNNKEWLGLIKQKIREQAQNVLLILGKARKDCVDVVNNHFKGLEQKVRLEIENEDRKNNLHSFHRLQTINELLCREFNDLLVVSNQVSSPKFLDLVRLIEEEILRSSDSFHAQVSKELKQNEIYSTGVIYISQSLTGLQSSLKKLINLEFVLPKVSLLSSSPPKLHLTIDKNKQSTSLATKNASSNLINKSCQNSPRFHQSSPINIKSPITLRKNSQVFISKYEPSLIQHVHPQKSKENGSSSVSLTKLHSQCSKLSYSTFLDSRSNFFR